MGASEDLFELIKTLDKGERSRVRKYAMLSREDDSPPYYLLLFEELCKLQTYDERAFRQEHSKAVFQSSFAQNKIYLYNLILDALKAERKYAKLEKPKDLQIREWIEEAQLLKLKGLPAQSIKRLQKARKEAERHQYFEVLLDVLKLLRSHLSDHQDSDYAANMREILPEIEWVGEQIHLNCRLIRLRDELFMAMRAGLLQPGVQDSYHALLALRQEVYAETTRPVNVEIHTSFNLAISFYEMARGDMMAGWLAYQAVYHLWRDHSDFKEVRRTRYARLLYNFLGISIAARQDQDIVEAVDSLERGPFHTKDERLEALQDGVYVRLQYYLSYGLWENALEVEAEFSEAAKEWVVAPMPRHRMLAFCMSFARLSFVLELEDKVRHYLGFFEEVHEQGIHDDKLAEARVIEVMNSFGKPDAEIENAIRAARRFLKGLKGVAAYYDAFLAGLASLLRRPVSEITEAWDELIHKLQETAGQVPYDGGVFLMRAWARAMRDGKPLKDYID